MHLINVRNVHEALPEAIYKLYRIGIQRASRNGPVLVAPEPVTTLYQSPTERVIFWPERDANPFFHLFESLWMLGGRRDVAFVQQFASNMASYSDDKVNFHGAYGHRWRKAFGFDQLKRIAENLKRNPDDRRQVLGIWSPKMDLDAEQGSMLDLPCNLTAHFQVNVWGALDMTVFNRSNDIIWGCYGANAVHFSVLQEYMAARVGCPVGRYWQVSDNWHGYLSTLEPLRELQARARDPFTARLLAHSPYEEGLVSPLPLLAEGEDPDVLDQDIEMFLDEGTKCMGYRTRFMRRVVLPMLHAWRAFKGLQAPERYDHALDVLTQCHASDWRHAAVQWIGRRRDKWLASSPVASEGEQKAR